MPRAFPIVVVVGAAVAVVGGAWAVGGTAPGVTVPPPARPSPILASVAAARTSGVAGCASAACHGGPASHSLARPGEPGCWTSSATQFLAADPHTRAYTALENELATRIMIGLTGERTPGVPKTPATDDVRCVACHTNPTLVAPADQLSASELAARRDGVSCEACHGSAGGWRHEHTTWTTATRAAGYERTGMAKLYDLGERARACAGCHVGAPADDARGGPVRDVNHDMIAAGHPRLNFDFADSQRRLPPHWHEQDRATGSPRGPDFEVQAWLVGRVAHAEAACRLLADRADRVAKRDPRTPWPEFAEWNCVSCHHRTGEAYTDAADGPAPGAPAWQAVWPITRPGAMEVPAVRDLLKVIEDSHPPVDRTRVAATTAAGALAGLRTELAVSPDVSATIERLLKEAPVRRSLDRDAAGQLFFALAAVERTRLRREPTTEPNPAFDRLRAALRLPRGTLRFDVPPEARAELERLMPGVR